MVKLNNALMQRMISLKDRISYDEACKAVLSSKSILAYILHEVVDEFKDVDRDYIQNYCIEQNVHIGDIALYPNESDFIEGVTNEDSIEEEGKVYYDLRFYATVPKNEESVKILINLEAQNKNPAYPIPKRGIYYSSRMISSQYGIEFKNSHYEQLKKVFSIWICMNPSASRRQTISRYSIRKEDVIGHYKENVEDYDLMEIIVINLGIDDDRENQGILKMLKVLLDGKMETRRKKNILENEFKIRLTQEEEDEVENMCNLSFGLIEEGLELGIKQGTINGKIESIRNIMITLNLTVEQALDAVQISEEERDMYKEMISKA